MRDIKLKFVVRTKDCIEVTESYYLCDLMEWVNVLSEYSADEILHELQYIGLEDKNGQEIYVGDIVKDNENRYFEIGYCFDYKNKDDRKHFARFEMRCINQGNLVDFTRLNDIVGIMDWVYYENHLEIIGNKYENLELLS